MTPRPGSTTLVRALSAAALIIASAWGVPATATRGAEKDAEQGYGYALQWQYADGHSYSPISIAVSATGDVAVSGEDDKVHLYSSDGQEKMVYDLGFDAMGIAYAPDGLLWLTDYSGHAIVAMRPDGTIGGRWESSGSDTSFPWGITVNAAGQVFVTDPVNSQILFGPASDPTTWTTFGTPGSGPGQLDKPYDIAVGPGGLLYVAGGENLRVQVFDATGSFVREWGQGGTGPGQFSNTLTTLAVAPDGTVLTRVSFNPTVSAFSATGGFLGTFGDDHLGDYTAGLAVDAAGAVYVGDLVDEPVFWGVAKYVPAASPPSPATRPGRVRHLTVTGNAQSPRRNVTWRSPRNDGGSPVTRYKIVVTKAKKQVWKHVLGKRLAHPKIVLESRKLPSGRLTIKVSATNAHGTSTPRTTTFVVR